MSKSKPFRIKGWHVLAGFIAFFGVIIAVNVAFITTATRTFPGESVKRPYEKGIRYNETLEARQRAVDEAWSASVAIENKDAFVVRINNVNGPVDGLELTVRLYWPGLPKADRHLKLLPSGPGEYRVSLDGDALPERAFEFEGEAIRSTDQWVFPFKGRL